jgi:hypothetical protein
MCTVPKHLLDDLETNFPARTKSGMLKALADALSKGKYPGWEREREAARATLKRQKTGPVEPKPIRNKEGRIAQGRQDQAASALGRQFLVTFYDSLTGVDLHSCVRLLVLRPHVLLCALVCSYVLTSCVLPAVWGGHHAHS